MTSAWAGLIPGASEPPTAAGKSPATAGSPGCSGAAIAGLVLAISLTQLQLVITRSSPGGWQKQLLATSQRFHLVNSYGVFAVMTPQATGADHRGLQRQPVLGALPLPLQTRCPGPGAGVDCPVPAAAGLAAVVCRPARPATPVAGEPAGAIAAGLGAGGRAVRRDPLRGAATRNTCASCATAIPLPTRASVDWGDSGGSGSTWTISSRRCACRSVSRAAWTNCGRFPDPDQGSVRYLQDRTPDFVTLDSPAPSCLLDLRLTPPSNKTSNQGAQKCQNSRKNNKLYKTLS